jgi:Fe-S cluster biogenesis protein NfuA
MTVDRDLVDERIAEVNNLMAAHAGGIELVDGEADGALIVRFTGMCTGCFNKPVTMATTIRPALMHVPGVTSVMAEGGRISDEAEERLASYATPSFRWAVPSRENTAGPPSPVPTPTRSRPLSTSERRHA